MTQTEGRKFYVYEHWRPDKGVCFYVGKGHGRRDASPSGRNQYHSRIQGKLAALGLKMEVRRIADHLTEPEAFALEKERIAHWRGLGVSLTNQTDGGEGSSGFKPTDEYRHKMSESVKQAWSDPDLRRQQSERQTGRKRPPGTGEKISKALRGKPKTEEHRRHCSEWQSGRVLPEAHKQAIGAARKSLWKTGEYREKVLAGRAKARAEGRYPSARSEATRAKISAARGKPVRCIDDGRRFPSAKAAAKFYGSNTPNISKSCLSGGRRRVFGLTFQYEACA